MSEANGPSPQGLTGAFARREQLLEAFEAAWRRGERPAVEDYLPAGAAEPELLLDLLQADLEYRLQAGESARVEDYRGRFQALEDREFVLELIGREHRLRRGREPGLGAGEYADRFPHLRDQLPRHLSPVEAAVPRAEEPAEAGPGEPDPPPPGPPPLPATGEDLGTPRPPPNPPRAFPAIAGFEILGELGRGGMGVDVLFTTDGTPKITDFGLAKRVEGGAGLTQTGAVVGTPSYMAPEQAGGKGKEVGPAADVYALGVILYECLTGTRPFDDENALVLLRKVAEEEPVAPRKRVVGVPADLDLICLKCLAKEPAERYPSAAALAADLKRFARGEPVSVRAAGLVERLAKWARRQPTLAVAYALLILAVGLTGLTTVVVRLWREAADARREAEAARDREKEAREREETARQAVARWEYARTVDLAHREFRENQVQRARLLLEDCRPELRGWEWHYVHRLCYADVLTILGDDRTDVGKMAVYSPDGTRIATVGGIGSSVPEWDASTGKLVRTLAYRPDEKVSHSPFSLAYNSDGSLILIGGNGAALLCDPRTGKEVQRFPQAGSRVAISPDGATVASLHGYRLPLEDRDGLILWDRRTGEVRKKLPGVGTAAFVKFSNVLAFGPDGTTLAAIRYDPRKARDRIDPMDYVATIWDVKTGTERLTLRADGGVRSVAFSRAGTRIITCGWSDKARVWDATTGKEVLTVTGQPGEFWKAAFWSAAFSPDGSLIVTAGSDRTARVWEAATGTEIATLRGHTSDVCHVCFSPDGRHILTSGEDRTARVWHTLARGDIRSLWGGWKQDEKGDPKRHPNGGLVWSGPPVGKFAFSRDGRRIATIKGRVIQVWDAASGAEIRQFGLNPDLAYDPASTVGLLGSPLGEGSLLAAVSCNLQVRFNESNIRLAWSPDGSRIVTGGPDNMARVWDVATGRVVLTLQGHTEQVGPVAYSADGARIATGGNWGSKSGKAGTGSAALWDANTGALLRALECVVEYRKGFVRTYWFQTGDGFSFSPDGRRVLAWGLGAVVWDVATGQARIALGLDRQEIIRLGPAKQFYSACFSADGARIATAGDDGVARVWDAVNGTELLTLKGQADVRSVSYSPDGTRLITTDLGGTAKIWDALTGAEMLTLQDAGSSAVFSPDGKSVVTGGGSSAGLKRWDPTPVHRGTFTSAGSVAAPPKR
jgi:WD40 repeat protein